MRRDAARHAGTALLDGVDVPAVDRGPAGAAPGAERYTCVGDTFTSSGSYYSNLSARVS